MTCLLAAGVFVLAFIVGRLALARRLTSDLRRSALACHCLALVFGVAFLTIPLVGLAVAGTFRVAWLGALCWVAAIASLAVRPISLRMPRWVDIADVIALIAGITFITVAVSGRYEALGAGRDQQAYAEAAVALSERGNGRASYSPLDEADRALLRGVSGVVVPDVADLHPDTNQSMSLTRPLGWPVWLAIAHAMFGMGGVYAANSVVYALGGMLFFVLLRLLVHPAIAVAATALLFALPSSLWIARNSLSEPMAMTLLLAIPLFAAAGIQRSAWPIAVILAAASLVRIDAALGVPATIAAAILTGGAATTSARPTVIRRFASIQLLVHVVTLLMYAALFPQILRDLSGYIAVITASALVATLAAYLVTFKSATHLRRLVNSRIFRLTAVAVLVCLFIYAVGIRPTLEPFSTIRRGLPGLADTRDFREDSLLNLATYISWPILLAALGGVCYGLWNRWPTREGLLLPLLLALGLGPALLYLWFPHVSPDHPWAFRRFVTTVVPYSVLFAAVFVHALAARIRRGGPALGALALVAPYSLIVSSFGSQWLFFRENDGITDEIATIARELPNSLVVATGVDPNVAAALLVAYGKPVAFINDDLSQTDDFVEVSDWIDAKSKLGHPAWLLHGPDLSYTGGNFTFEREWRMSRQFIAPSYRAPARAVATQNYRIILSRADGLDRSFARHMFGGERAWGAPGRHFFRTEVAPFGEFRYTNGFSWIDVPAEALSDAEALKLDLYSYARPGERRWLHVLIDEQPVWGGDVDSGVSTLRIPITTPTKRVLTRITLLSEPIDRSEISPNDPRINLSIGLIGIRPLGRGEPVISGSTMDAFRSKLARVDIETGPIRTSVGNIESLILDVRNDGTAYWPTVQELGGPAGAVQIALRWYRHNDPDRFVGDNRWPMSIAIFAGDHTRIKVPLSPIGLDGKALPAGEYDVRIGMVRETVALFADNGDAVISVPVVVAP